MNRLHYVYDPKEPLKDILKVRALQKRAYSRGIYFIYRCSMEGSWYDLIPCTQRTAYEQASVCGERVLRAAK